MGEIHSVSPAVLLCSVVLHTGKRWFIICPVAEHPAAEAPEPSPPLPLSSVQPEASQGKSSRKFHALLPGSLVTRRAGSARTVTPKPSMARGPRQVHLVFHLVKVALRLGLPLLSSCR